MENHGIHNNQHDEICAFQFGKWIFRFSFQLYPTTRPKLTPTQALNSAITVAELQEKYPFLQWKAFLDQAFQSEYSLLDTVYLLWPQYIQAVQKIIPHFDERYRQLIRAPMQIQTLIYFP